MQPQHVKPDGNFMRTIRIKLYQFKELSKEAQETALQSQAKFETETMEKDSQFYWVAKEMEKMKTPWFITETIYHDCRASLIETILANEYEFTENGKIA